MPSAASPSSSSSAQAKGPEPTRDQADEQQADEQQAEAPPVPLLELREGLPPVAETSEALSEVVEAIRSGRGPVAVDAERASGYRYSARAYLIQLRREGSGSALVDPIPFQDMTALAEAIGDAEWILHAASQDLPCLAELGMQPSSLFDTELAGRLLGYPRVGLATLVETIVGRRLRKEHSAVDWSTRPLPEPWLEYAALDVEPLIELRDALEEELEQTGKAEWARQEFQHLVTAIPKGPRKDPWRRTSGMHRARGRRALAAVRELWEARDAIAAQRDVTPGRIIPDSAIVEAANALPRDRATLLGIRGFKGRGAQRYAGRWVEAIQVALELPDEQLPPLAARYDGPPPPRSWADRDPVAAARLTTARSELAVRAKDLNLPVENLLTPDFVRRLMWEPPEVAGHELGDALAERLGALGAREWQIEITTGILAEAVLTAPAKAAEAQPPLAPTSDDDE